jgi:hypothetical protein
VIGSAGFVFGADVEREIPGLAAFDEQVLDGVEVSLGRAVLLEDVAPAAGADLEIEGSPDFDLAAELLDLFPICCGAGCARPALAASGESQS